MYINKTIYKVKEKICRFLFTDSGGTCPHRCSAGESA